MTHNVEIHVFRNIYISHMTSDSISMLVSCNFKYSFIHKNVYKKGIRKRFEGQHHCRNNNQLEKFRRRIRMISAIFNVITLFLVLTG